MTTSTFTSGAAGNSRADYQPGVCNIGPAEIRRRRTTGHVGLVATLLLVATLIVIDAPPITRLLAVLPAAASASGYLQAWLKFCAGYGSRGVFNFGTLGDSTAVENDAARAMDRRRARQIGLEALTVGLAVGIGAVLLPV